MFNVIDVFVTGHRSKTVDIVDIHLTHFVDKQIFYIYTLNSDANFGNNIQDSIKISVESFCVLMKCCYLTFNTLS